MKALGIICEYNPFHNGHLALIQKAKIAYPDKKIFCFMSGEFVQRGEIALFSASDRARAATLCGADGVFELPSAFCLAPAQIYARNAIRLIAAMGICDVLVFGSESGDKEALVKMSERLYSKELDEKITLYLKDNSYPEARELAYRTLYGDGGFPNTPNDILAVEYINALKDFDLDFLPINRSGGDGICSATALRALAVKNADMSPFMPSAASDVFKEAIAGGRMRKEENYERAFLSALVFADGDFADVPKDFAPKIKECARQSRNISEYYERLSVKHYTSARRRRMSLCTALGITKKEWDEPIRYVKLLALRASAGAEIKKSKIPVLSKSADVRLLGDEAAAYFEREAKRALFAFNAQGNTLSLADVYRSTPFIIKE